MRSLLGLLWALGGAIAGVLVAMVVVKVGNITSREGAAGYATLGIAIIGAIIGAVARVVLCGRSAPAGQGVALSGSAVL